MGMANATRKTGQESSKRHLGSRKRKLARGLVMGAKFTRREATERPWWGFSGGSPPGCDEIREHTREQRLGTEPVAEE